MAALNRFNTINQKISAGVESIGLFAFVMMMVITTLNVLGAKIFLIPMSGAIDIMMLAQLVSMAFALGSSLIYGRHVQVEFFVPLLPKRLQAVTDLMVRFLGLGLFVVLVWQLWLYGHDLQTRGEVSPTARIPLYPFAYACAVAFVPGCMVYLSLSIESLLKVFKHES